MKQIFFFIFSCLFIFGQNLIHINKDKGLSQSSVTSLLQDKTGFIWVGTQDGLNRYNGQNFEIYRLNHMDTNSISNNEINDIIQAKDGSYWIATTDGINHLSSPFSNKFKRYFSNSKDSNSLISNFALNLVEDSYGNIWIGTKNGLSKFNPKTHNFTNFSETSPDHKIPNNMIYNTYEDSFERLFISTSRYALVYNVENKSFDQLANIEYVTKFFEDNKRRLWVGALEEGLILYDPSSQKVIKKFKKHFETITDIEQINDNELWIGTAKKGIFIFDLSTEEFTAFDEKKDHIQDEAYVRDIEKGINDIVWISAGLDGFLKYDPNQVTFKHITNKPSDNKTLSSRLVWAMIEDHKGNVWVGTEDGGLNKYDPITEEVQRISDPNGIGPTAKETIVSLFEDKDHRIWIGTENNGSILYNPRTNIFKRITRDDQKDRGYYFNEPRKYIQDEDGTLWIGTTYGLYRMNPENFYTKQFVPDTSKNYIDDVNAINDIIFDGDFIWVATRYGGLYKFNKEKERFENFEHQSKDFPVHPYIMSLHKDRYGDLWIGTLQGLNRFDFRNNKKYTYTNQDGLPNDVIYGILEDIKGNLWVSTNNGLSKIDLSNKDNIIFDTFDYQNQIQSLEYNQYAYHRGKTTNNLYFGGVNGFNIIETKDIHTKTPTPIAYIAQINLDNQRLPVVSAHQELEFSYEYNLIEFDFSAIQYTDPHKLNFEYKLIGFQDKWIKIGKKNHVNFTNLPGSEYELKIKAYTNDTEKNFSYASYKFTVTPPFWLEWWFKVFIIFSVIIFVYVIIKLRLKNMKKEKVLLEHKVNERTTIIKSKMEELVEANEQINKQTDELIQANASLEEALNDLNNEKQKHHTMVELIVHDLKNPLNNILTLSHQKPNKEDLEIINQSGNQILNLSMNLLETAKFEYNTINLEIDHCNLYKIVTDAFAQVRLLAKQKNITFINEVVPVIFVKVDFEIILRVFINLFTNAIKNSFYNGQIKVSHEIIGTDIVISVEDNGKGIPKEKLNQIFDKYSRVENLEDKTIRSSGLGLTFCKLAIEKHDGKIYAKSVENEFTTIFLQLALSTVKNMTEEVIEPVKVEIKRFDFNEDQIIYLKPFIKKLSKLMIHEISDIIEILEQVGSSDKLIKEWSEKVKYAALNMEEDHYDKLLKVTISENA